jgi:hypothetical protein
MLSTRFVTLVAALCTVGAVKHAAAQYQVASPDGKSSLRFGVFSQVQGEWIDSGGNSKTSQNLFLRRARLMFGGKLGDRISFFLETDSPNIGKAAADGTKSEATIYVQDMMITYALSDTWKLDGGLMLVPLAYQTGQGATTLLGVDYSPYAFTPSAATGSRLGRDYGAQARGYLFGKHLELRTAVLQGVRGAGSGNPLRLFARAVYYPFEGQSDFFYTGTTFGKRKLLGIGASYDRQKSYATVGADFFFDRPVGGGNALTMQANYWHVDGASFLTTLPKQDLWSVEAGLYVGCLRLTPFVQAGQRHFAHHAQPSESSYQGGIAYWIDGHKFNLKLGVGRLAKDGTPNRTQVLAQTQLLLW